MKPVTRRFFLGILLATPLSKILTSNKKSPFYLPVGYLTYWNGKNCPQGFLPCNGQIVSKALYKDLYNVIGETYGWSTNNKGFALPQLGSNYIVKT